MLLVLKSRKYQLTFNNPQEHGCSHEFINSVMNEKFNFTYYCLCDEVGENRTPHTHLFFYCENAVLFETVKKRFPTAHIEKAKGTNQENRDYIRKEGKYLNSEKKETNIIETFEEYGEMPIDTPTKNEKQCEAVLRMIDEGFTNAEIIRAVPSYATKIPHINTVRQTLLEEKNSKKWRDLDITYIYGETGTGKTRSVMEKYGYDNVYKTTNYQHPFDGYNGEDVILLDEFRSSIQFGDLLQFLDGYPCKLPARYTDKVACYTKVYIISNIKLCEQYKNIQTEQPQSWNGLIRRINTILQYNSNEKIEEFPEDYII